MAQDNIPDTKRVATTAPVTGTDTVTVGCKLPHGLHLDIVKIGEPVDRHTINGSNSSRIVGGYGITEGVPRAFWERWLEQSKALAMVKNGLIFAHAEAASVISKAKDGAAEINGFERIDPSKPPKGIAKSDDIASAALTV